MAEESHDWNNMTMEEIQRVAKYEYNMNDGFFKMIQRYNELKENEEWININYTNDEYGEAAKELGLINRVYKGDAGIDLPIVLSREERKHGGKIVWSNERELLHTGMILEFPLGYWGRIIHRSSTEKLYRLRVIEGIIDDYRGPLLVQVHNGNTSNITVEHGQRLAQLIIIKVTNFKCRVVDKLRPSVRGTSGFGSSGGK